jgi:endonuclease/exonuclease/phosphatase family metal-dependent hydrolase
MLPNSQIRAIARIRESVIDTLGADVIALEEIDDRDALEQIFGNRWRLIIDDDSGNTQDVALAVRSDLELPDFGNDLDADDDDFLFSGSTNNEFFPNRRDVLAVNVRVPDENVTFTVLVIHAKSRFGGRTTTEPRRIGAAVALIQRIGADYDGQPVVVLGDFNDTPDDRSLNVLETGNAEAGPGPDRQSGPFLINVTEPLYNDGSSPRRPPGIFDHRNFSACIQK